MSSESEATEKVNPDTASDTAGQPVPNPAGGQSGLALPELGGSMKFLIDKSAMDIERKLELTTLDLIGGQLITPLTAYAPWRGLFAIDNGAFTRFHQGPFHRLLKRREPERDRCLFVVCPDVVGNARRTLELWKFRHNWLRGWPMAFVAQDGMEDMEVPWDEMTTLFIGGGDPWKDSQASKDLVKTAKCLEKHVHVGRVNTYERYKAFCELGADTCDGSGVSMYDHMLQAIEDGIRNPPQPQAESVETFPLWEK